MYKTFYDLNHYAVFSILFIFLLAVSQSGFVLGRYVKKRASDKSHRSSEFISSTFLGMVSLILGFTFSMAINRYEHRKDLVLKEVNAIGTISLRSRLLPQPQEEKILGLVKNYVDARLEFYDVGPDLALVERAENKAVRIQDQLWEQAVQITKTARGPVEAIFVSALNAMIDVQAERAIALRNTVPGVVYGIILMITGVGLASLAFANGVRNENGLLKLSLLAFLFASVVTMIHDLDRPRTGTITISQEAMRALQKSMSQAP